MGLAILALGRLAHAQTAPASPEIALRELASGQIKKGVRSIGFGGDGATWGNYSLVWRDAGTALVDGGITGYTNGNTFSFTAVGATTPPLWHDLVVYAIALSQWGQDEHFALRSPSFGDTPVAVRGDGSNQAFFVKVALPVTRRLSMGVLLSYERSLFDVFRADGMDGTARYSTDWLPSGGFGISYQAHPRVLTGFRVILNHDTERRLDASGTHSGLAQSYEFREGLSVAPWRGGLLDVGITALYRRSRLNGTERWAWGPNVGIEQSLVDGHLAFRAGLDEQTFGAGFTVRFRPVRFDAAYLFDLGQSRIGTIFGTDSHSVLVTLTFDYLPAPTPVARASAHPS